MDDCVNGQFCPICVQRRIQREARERLTQRFVTAGLVLWGLLVALACIVSLSSCTDATLVCEHDLDGSVDARPPCPHPDTATSMHASVHDMCAASCFTEIVCGLPTELCRDRCFVPHDGRTEAHYYAVRECISDLLPLTCEGWHACMALP